MTDQKHYSLSELVAQCAPNAHKTMALQEPEQVPVVGIDHAITQHAMDVITLAIRVWESQELALDWLQRPIAALSDERPCDFLGTREGCRRITETLRKIEQGDFS